MSEQHHKLPWNGLLHLIIVYVVWSSTYLAMRETALGGFHPLQMAASRVVIAAALLMVIARLSGNRIRLTLRETGLMAVTGVLLWLGGNLLVAAAEKRIASGLTALIIGSTPIWPPIFEFILDRRKPTSRMIVSLLTGFAGLIVLLSPMLTRDEHVHTDLGAALMVVFASFSWACGSMLLQRRPVDLPPVSISAWQHTFGAIGMLVCVLFSSEPASQPTQTAWIAWAYLIVFGSLLSFTSYIKIVRLLPMPVVMTYAYVNPVIAVTLGSLVLREPITPTMVGGMVLVLLGVAGIFHERLRRR